MISVVVPCKNEADNIHLLDKEIKKVLDNLGKYEVVYVNDGSTDQTLGELKKLKNAKIIDLQRNYGQAIALDAGFKCASGDLVISLDGDLQNDPQDIPKLIAELKKENLDVVAGWRKYRKDKLAIKILTKIGRFLRSIIIHDPVHDTGCTLRVYKKECVKNLDLWGEMHRYILALLKWKGYRIGEMEVNHRPRKYGQTKYSSRKAIKGFVDLIYIWFIYKYSMRPLHLFGSIGVFATITGVIIEFWALYEKVVQQIDLTNNAWFILGFFFIMIGIQLFISGIIVDLALRTYFNSSTVEKRYQVKAIIVQ